MRKLYITMSMALLAGAAFAQNLNNVQLKGGKVPTYVPSKPMPTVQNNQSIYVDYDFMDEDYQVNTAGFQYGRYIWDMNMRYSYTAGDTSLKWASVDFSDFYDSYNTNSAIAFNTFNSYVVDSVFFIGGHENNSGQNDTLVVALIQLNGSAYPTSTVLWSDTIISNTGLSNGNDWLTTALVALPCGYVVPNNTTKVGVEVRYYGATQDTFGLIAGFGDVGVGTCQTIPTLPFAVKSNYYRNSYRHDMRFALPPFNIALLPTTSNQDTYYDCDGSGSYNNTSANLVDGENFLQNWGIWAHFTLQGVGVEENEANGIQLGQNTPNPANGTTVIRYNLATKGNVSFELYDVSGKLVMNMNQGEQVAGAHQIEINAENLQTGVYFYSLNVDGKRVTRRMVVTE
jgi:hypothetical protein